MWLRWSRPQCSGSTADESSYIASATDLMTGVLFVFIIMVAYLALQKQMEAAQRGANKDPRGEVTRLIGRQLAKMMPNIVVDSEKGLITLPEDALFDSGSAVLRERARVKLQRMSATLATSLQCFVANQRSRSGCADVPRSREIDTIFIEGHTDSVPLMRPGGNLQLSLERAISVSQVLVHASGLDDFRNRHEQPIFAYSAYGDQRLLNRSNPASPKNRRVVLRIVLSYQPDSDRQKFRLQH